MIVIFHSSFEFLNFRSSFVLYQIIHNFIILYSYNMREIIHIVIHLREAGEDKRFFYIIFSYFSYWKTDNIINSCIHALMNPDINGIKKARDILAFSSSYYLYNVSLWYSIYFWQLQPTIILLVTYSQSNLDRI